MIAFLSKADEQHSTSCNNIIVSNAILNLSDFYINGSHLNPSVNNFTTVDDENSPSKYNRKSASHDYYRLVSEHLRHFSPLPYHIREVMSELKTNELALNISHTESFSKRMPNIEQDSSLPLILLHNIESECYTVKNDSR